LEEARARGEFPGKRKVAAIRRSALAFAPEEAAPENPEPFAVGATVRVLGTAAVGVVGRVIGDRVEVQVGDKRMWVERMACQPVESAPPHPRAAIEVPSVETTIPAELKLIGHTKEEAREELERFLDRAALAGVSFVRVVHGHGTGALRKVVQEVLSTHPAVARFAHPPQHRGGTGVTEAELDSR
jgi:DNA mismatch repair protein MutS2